MNYDEYQIACLPTLAVKQKLRMNLQHAAIGLVTEVGEVFDIVKKGVFYDTSLQHYSFDKIDKTKFLDEFGDCMWYLSIAFTYCQEELKGPITLMLIEDDFEFVKNLVRLHTWCNSILTAAMSEPEGPSSEDLNTALVLIASLTKYLSIDMEDVMSKNISKLRTRYEKNGGNFDEACARIRNESAERLALESN